MVNEGMVSEGMVSDGMVSGGRETIPSEQVYNKERPAASERPLDSELYTKTKLI